MIILKEKQKCCGCTACYNGCPVKAITMEPDIEGFLYPRIDEEKCVQCGLCEKICPVLNRECHEEMTEGYIIRYKNAEIVEESTSGGAFTAFATFLLNNGYVVYGAGYDDDMQVVCKEALKLTDLKEMRGSKFVQSNLGNIFQTIKRQLKEDQKILFTGTPCQVAGLISYLGGKPENLICIDFVCRGVPSPGLWKNYVDMMEKTYGSKMVGARFKHKTYGYHGTTMKVDFANGKTWYGSGRVDPMMKAFVTEMASRPSCHICAFKGVERQSDVTMFDCYEFSRITGMRDDDKGYSSVFIHSKTGRALVDALGDDIFKINVSIDELVTENGIMVSNSSRPHEKRNEFYRAVSLASIDKAINEVAPITRKDYIIEKSKRILFLTGMMKYIRKLKKKHIIAVTK